MFAHACWRVGQVPVVVYRCANQVSDGGFGAWVESC